MKMHNRLRVERPNGREFRITAHTVRGKDVGTLQVAMWNPELKDWELQELSREDVRAVCTYLTAWLVTTEGS